MKNSFVFASRHLQQAVFFLSLTLLALNLQISQAHAEEDEKSCDKKACFDRKISRDEIDLSLRSSTLFQYLIFDVSTIALYTDNNSGDVLSDTPKSLLMHYHREISKEQMIENTTEHFALNPNVNLNEYADELRQLYSLYKDVKDGDLYELNYIPSKGLSLIFNGELLGTIQINCKDKSAKFARDFFGLWFSQYTFSQKTRDNLLKPLRRRV